MIAYGRDYADPFAVVQEGEQIDAPLYVDIGALLAGGLPEPPQPSVLTRADGVGLFYRGQVNGLFGEPESGKTWIAQAALTEELAEGRSGLIVDLDHNGAAATVARLLLLGVEAAILMDPSRFRYTEIDEASDLDRVVADTRAWRPAAVIVDSIGEMLPLLGMGSNSPDEFTVAHARVLKPIARTGAAVLGIDHLPKNALSKSHGPTGTAAKRRAIGGTSLRVELIETFVPGRGGSARLLIHKDRHGGLRQHCEAQGAGETTAGVFAMTHGVGGLTWTVAASDGHGPSTATASADASALDQLQPPPESQRDVQARMSWGGSRAMLALREWRALRSACAPEEQGAASVDDAPRSSTPVSGSAEQGALADVQASVLIADPDPAGQRVADIGRVTHQPDQSAIVPVALVLEGESDPARPPDLGSPVDHAAVNRDDLGAEVSLVPAESDTGGSPVSFVAPSTPLELMTERRGDVAPCGHLWEFTNLANGKCGACILGLPPDAQSDVDAPPPDNGNRDGRKLALGQLPTTSGLSA